MTRLVGESQRGHLGTGQRCLEPPASWDKGKGHTCGERSHANECSSSKTSTMPKTTEFANSVMALLVRWFNLLKHLIRTRLKLDIHLVGYLSTVCLLSGVGVNLYTTWTVLENIVTFLVICVGLILRYCLTWEKLGQAVLHIWLGGVLGMVVFSQPPHLGEEESYNYTNIITNDLFLASLSLNCLWNVIEVLFSFTTQETVLLSNVEIYEVIGLVVGTLAAPKADPLVWFLLIVAFCVTTISIRLKSLLGILNLFTLVIISSMFLFPLLSPVNLYGLSCFAGRIAVSSIKDLLFSGSTSLDRWTIILSRSKIIRHLGILATFLMKLAMCPLIGVLAYSHKEWYIVVPIFFVCALIWLCFHVISFISVWKLMVKITDCNITYASLSITEDGAKSMNRVMSSKGVRHFALISQRLLCLRLVMTLVLLAIGWETRTGLSLTLGLIILPLDSMAISLFHNLGSYLGGTCTGFGLVAPANLLRPSSGAKLLTPHAFHEIGSRSTTIINLVQRFFAYHMIDSYGCDYSTSGLTLEYVNNKLRAFFDRHTSDGPRFDTYIVYYSGDVYEKGDWALADNVSLSLDTILEWWQEKNKGSGARLLFVMDTLHSYHWARQVSYVKDAFVAVQTCKFLPKRDPESSTESGIGDFTLDWIDYNCGRPLSMTWSEKGRPIQSVFGVSRIWTDFSFHLPTEHDFAQHWDNNFPKLTRPLIRAVNFPQTGSLCCCSDCVTRWVKRKKMRWLPPKEIDTGHGFKLVRS